jgi:hypothetical protein
MLIQIATCKDDAALDNVFSSAGPTTLNRIRSICYVPVNTFYLPRRNAFLSAAFAGNIGKH